MRSASAKSRERKGPTSATVEGPPMFMKTMAVGPEREVRSCMTGGTTVAIERTGEVGSHGGVSGMCLRVGVEGLWRRAMEARSAMAKGDSAVSTTEDVGGQR